LYIIVRALTDDSFIGRNK